MTVPKVDALVVSLRQFEGQHTVAPTSLPASEAGKLKGLAAKGMHFLGETPALKTTITTRLQGAIRAGKLDVATWLQVVAAATKDHVVARFEGQQDVHLAAPSPEYRALKVRKGQDARVGIATGTLLRVLKAARWVTRRGA